MSEKIVKFQHFPDGFSKNEFTVKIYGDFVIDEICYRKVSNDVHIFRIIFNKPKYFDLVSGDTITVIPRDGIKSQLSGVIQIEIFSSEKDRDYRILCEGSRYIIDAVLIKKSLFEDQQNWQNDISKDFDEDKPQEEQLRIAKTIIQQMGGIERIKSFMYVFDIFSLETGIQFSFNGSNKVNKVVIELNKEDFYSMEFYKVLNTKNIKNSNVINTRLKKSNEPIITYDNVYYDQLAVIFEKVTGICLHMEK